MHIEKNILDNFLGTLVELEGKNNDTLNSRIDLKNLGIRKNLQLKPTSKEGTKYTIEPRPYYLKKEFKRGFCQYLFDCTFPDGFCSNMSS